nr:uncharacterized protein LOC109752338 [Aegilops tauschii subsp. strangulata]
MPSPAPAGTGPRPCRLLRLRPPIGARPPARRRLHNAHLRAHVAAAPRSCAAPRLLKLAAAPGRLPRRAMSGSRRLLRPVVALGRLPRHAPHASAFGRPTSPLHAARILTRRLLPAPGRPAPQSPPHRLHLDGCSASAPGCPPPTRSLSQACRPPLGFDSSPSRYPDPPSADREDIHTVIENVAKDAAAEAEKIATEEAAKGAAEDTAKGSARQSGKAAAEEAEADLEKHIAEAQAWFCQVHKDLKAAEDVLAERDLALVMKQADIEKAQELAKQEAARHQQQVALNSQEEDLAAREGRLAATLHGKDEELKLEGLDKMLSEAKA